MPTPRATDGCADQPALLIGDPHVVGAEEVALQIMEPPSEHLQPQGLHPVVAVDEAERVALDVRETLVAGGGESARAGVDENLGAGEPFCVGAHDVAGAIGRAVVDRDELQGVWVIELTQQRLERRADVGRGILRGEDRGDLCAAHGFGCWHPHVNAR